MTRDQLAQLKAMIPLAGEEAKRIIPLVQYREIPDRSVLLREGEIAHKLYIIVQGCLRAYFTKEDGTEITSQFFFEGQMVASFESALTGKPSRIYIEAIEPASLFYISITNLKKILSGEERLREHFNQVVRDRLVYYMNLYSSFILDSPEERYKALLRDNPRLLERVPQQYIASFLGITPVSLSRIKGRLKRRN